MAGTPPKRNVAIFIDMENLFGGYKKDVTAVPLRSIVKEIEKVVQTSGLGGLTATARAYANWGREDMAGYRNQVLENNIKPVQIFSFDQEAKNAADIELVVDALEVAADMPWIELFVIVSGDGDFVPLIRRLHALGKRSVVATTNLPNAGWVNKLLPSVADLHHIMEVAHRPATKLSQPAVAAAVQADTASGKTSQKSPTKPVVPHPELELYKTSVLAFLNDDPTLRVSGLINVQRLGTLLRKRWPDVTYKTFGYATLTRFVEAGCGLEKLRHSAAKPAAVDPLAAKSVPDIKRS